MTVPPPAPGSFRRLTSDEVLKTGDLFRFAHVGPAENFYVVDGLDGSLVSELAEGTIALRPNKPEPVTLPTVHEVHVSRVANGFVLRLEPNYLARQCGAVCADENCYVFNSAEDLSKFLAVRLK